MHRTLSKIAAVALLALLLLGCSPSDGGGGGGQNPPPGPPPGTPRGTLVAEGTGYIHTFDLTNGSSWSQRLDYDAPWSAEAVVDSQRELLIAQTSGAYPVFVDAFDTSTFGERTSIEWPDSTDVVTLRHLAATRSGSHLALSKRESGDDFIEIIQREPPASIYTGLEPATGSSFVWSRVDELIVAIDLEEYEGSTEPSGGGVIVAFPLEGLAASTDGSLDGRLIAQFTRAQWGSEGVDDLALSPDGTELLFTRAGDLWVVSTEESSEALEPPHQLTTGPDRFLGAVFSPDGQRIALVAGSHLGLRETYVIPNHRGDPLDLDHRQGAGTEYLLEARTMVDGILAWLP